MQNKNVNDSYWMGLVDKIAEASTCRVDIGTLLIQKKVIVGVGYLGSLSSDNHCDDFGCLLVPNKGMFGSGDEKSCIRTVHAEMNAVLKCKARGTEDNWLTCYCTYQPCLNCLKALLSIGVRTIVYRKDYTDKWRDFFIDNINSGICITMYKV